jgi:DNA-binding LacI/PurR family transcriptional regulator
VFSGANAVAPELRDRVREVARRLGYQPNRVARNLRVRATRVIGLAVPDIENPFFISVIGATDEVLQEAGFSLLLASYNENARREAELLATFQAEGVAGIVFTPSNAPGADYAELVRAHTPLVAISRYPEGLNVDLVSVANQEGARAATAHLLRQGHREIAFINGPLAISTARERQAGFEQAFAEAGVALRRDLIRHADFRQPGGYECMRRLLEASEPPTAVFTANNLMTLGALQAIHESGWEIPDRIAVVGFDDMAWAPSLRPPLTAVAQPAREVGATAATLLLERIAQPERATRRVVLDTRLVVRASCGASPTAARG